MSGIVLRATGRPDAEESSTEFAARLEAEIGNVLAAVHVLLAEEGTSLAGGLWIVTERAVATEAGEPVDPVQAALWGLGRTVIGEQPMLRCRLVDLDGSDDAARVAGEPARHPRRRAGTGAAAGEVPGAAGIAVGAQRLSRGTAHVRLRPGTDRTWCDRQSAGDRHGAGATDWRARCRSGWRRPASTSATCSTCSASTRAIRGRSAATSRASSTATGPDVTEFEVGQRVFGVWPGSMASRVNVPVQLLALVPDRISAIAAASTPTAMLTALLAFDWAKLRRR